MKGEAVQRDRGLPHETYLQVSTSVVFAALNADVVYSESTRVGRGYGTLHDLQVGIGIAYHRFAKTRLHRRAGHGPCRLIPGASSKRSL